MLRADGRGSGGGNSGGFPTPPPIPPPGVTSRGPSSPSQAMSYGGGDTGNAAYSNNDTRVSPPAPAQSSSSSAATAAAANGGGGGGRGRGRAARLFNGGGGLQAAEGGNKHSRDDDVTVVKIPEGRYATATATTATGPVARMGGGGGGTFRYADDSSRSNNAHVNDHDDDDDDDDGGGGGMTSSSGGGLNLPLDPSLAVDPGLIWRNLWLFIWLKAIGSYDSGAFSSAVSRISDDWGLDYSAQGRLTSSVFLGNIIGCPLAGYLFTKYSEKKVLGVSLWVHAIFTFLFATFPSYYIALFNRFFVGMSLAFMIVYTPVWIDEFAPKDRQSIWMASQNAGVPIGIMMGFLAAMILPTYTSLDWTWAFYFKCLLMVPTIIYVTKVDARSINASEKASRSHNSNSNRSAVAVAGAVSSSPAPPPSGKSAANNSSDNTNSNAAAAAASSSPPPLGEGGLIGSSKSSGGGGFFRTLADQVRARGMAAVAAATPLVTNVVYMCSVLAMCSLYFVATGLQNVVKQYLEAPPFNASASTIMLGFGAAVVTAPVCGVITGGILLDRIGGYKGNLLRASSFAFFWSFFAALFAIICIFVKTTSGFLLIMSAVLFCGGAIIPPGAGLTMAALPDHLRSFGAAFSQLAYNTLGNFSGPLVCGFVADQMGDLKYGVRTLLIASGVGLVPMGIMVAVAFRRRGAYGYAGQVTLVSMAHHHDDDDDDEDEEEEDGDGIRSGDDYGRKGAAGGGGGGAYGVPDGELNMDRDEIELRPLSSRWAGIGGGGPRDGHDDGNDNAAAGSYTNGSNNTSGSRVCRPPPRLDSPRDWDSEEMLPLPFSSVQSSISPGGGDGGGVRLSLSRSRDNYPSPPSKPQSREQSHDDVGNSNSNADNAAAATFSYGDLSHSLADSPRDAELHTHPLGHHMRGNCDAEITSVPSLTTTATTVTDTPGMTATHTSATPDGHRDEDDDDDDDGRLANSLTSEATDSARIVLSSPPENSLGIDRGGEDSNTDRRTTAAAAKAAAAAAGAKNCSSYSCPLSLLVVKDDDDDDDESRRRHSNFTMNSNKNASTRANSNKPLPPLASFATFGTNNDTAAARQQQHQRPQQQRGRGRAGAESLTTSFSVTNTTSRRVHRNSHHHRASNDNSLATVPNTPTMTSTFMSMMQQQQEERDMSSSATERMLGIEGDAANSMCILNQHMFGLDLVRTWLHSQTKGRSYSTNTGNSNSASCGALPPPAADHHQQQRSHRSSSHRRQQQLTRATAAAATEAAEEEEQEEKAEEDRRAPVEEMDFSSLAAVPLDDASPSVVLRLPPSPRLCPMAAALPAS